MNELSPMMQQYMRIKEQYKDAILFFRLGDFYEMFYDDAKLVSSELDLTLTGKDCGQNERAPMCGIPYHSCDSYIARLVSKGYKVAMCDQVENPAQAENDGTTYVMDKDGNAVKDGKKRQSQDEIEKELAALKKGRE